MAATTEAEVKESRVRTRRPPTAIVAEEVPTAPAAKVKTTVELSWEAHERMSLHGLKLRKSNSELVEELINTHLRRFCIQDRGGASQRPEDAA